MFTVEERQKAFEDGFSLGLDYGKTNTEAAIKFALDRIFWKLGEKNTIDLIKSEALEFIDTLFERSKL
jgi:hypothetical protein